MPEQKERKKKKRATFGRVVLDADTFVQTIEAIFPEHRSDITFLLFNLSEPYAHYEKRMRKKGVAINERQNQPPRPIKRKPRGAEEGSQRGEDC